MAKISEVDWLICPICKIRFPRRIKIRRGTWGMINKQSVRHNRCVTCSFKCSAEYNSKIRNEFRKQYKYPKAIGTAIIKDIKLNRKRIWKK
jgi:hypothetical protein